MASISSALALPECSILCSRGRASPTAPIESTMTRCIHTCTQFHHYQTPLKSEESFGLRLEVGKGGIFRREVLMSSIALLSGGFLIDSRQNEAFAEEFTDMPALRGKDYGKTKMKYPDYTETESGLQYKDLRLGNGPTPKAGEVVVIDWDGYTIGYYGRIFEARNKTKGGSFEGNEKDFFKFRVGYEEVIPAFEEAVAGMAPGGIRSIAGS